MGGEGEAHFGQGFGLQAGFVLGLEEARIFQGNSGLGGKEGEEAGVFCAEGMRGIGQYVDDAEKGVAPVDGNGQHRGPLQAIKDGSLVGPLLVIMDDNRFTQLPNFAGDPFPFLQPGPGRGQVHTQQGYPLDNVFLRPVQVQPTRIRIQQVNGVLHNELEQHIRLQLCRQFQPHLLEHLQLARITPLRQLHLFPVGQVIPGQQQAVADVDQAEGHHPRDAIAAHHLQLLQGWVGRVFSPAGQHLRPTRLYLLAIRRVRESQQTPGGQRWQIRQPVAKERRKAGIKIGYLQRHIRHQDGDGRMVYQTPQALLTLTQCLLHLLAPGNIADHRQSQGIPIAG